MDKVSFKKTSQFPDFRLRVAEQMADYRQRLAERLVHERDKKSFSQDDLALRAGVNPKTVKRIEERKIDNPRAVTIRRLAEALEIEPAVLRPPPELEEDQLNRIEATLEGLVESVSSLVEAVAELQPKKVQPKPRRARSASS